MKTIKKGHLTKGLALLLSLSSYQAGASNPNNSIILTPNGGYPLTTVVGYISTYVDCMDNAQLQSQQHAQQQNITKSIIRYSSAFNNAQQTQCHGEYQQLQQSVDSPSLQSIDRITWQHWRKNKINQSISSEQRLKNSAVLTNGIERHTINSITSGVKQ